MYAVYSGITIAICLICRMDLNTPKKIRCCQFSVCCWRGVWLWLLAPGSAHWEREINELFCGGLRTRRRDPDPAPPEAACSLFVLSWEFTVHSAPPLYIFKVSTISFLESFHKTFSTSASSSSPICWPHTSDVWRARVYSGNDYDYYDLCFRASVGGNIPRFTHNLFQHHLKGVTNAPIEKVSAVTIGQ